MFSSSSLPDILIVRVKVSQAPFIQLHSALEHIQVSRSLPSPRNQTTLVMQCTSPNITLNHDCPSPLGLGPGEVSKSKSIDLFAPQSVTSSPPHARSADSGTISSGDLVLGPAGNKWLVIYLARYRYHVSDAIVHG